MTDTSLSACPIPRLARSIVLLAAATLTGCQSANTYRAAHLPPDLMAPPVRVTQQLNLSRLASSGYRSETIQPGDLVEVSITTGLEEEEAPGQLVRVSDQGMGIVPLVGQVRLAGLDLTQAEQVVGSESVRRGLYVSPTVAVSMRTRRSHQITVMGAVEKPGVTKLPATNSNLLAALAASGGLTKDAGTVVEIQHPTFFDGRGMVPPRSQRVDLDVATQQGGDFRLLDGATVTVLNKPFQAIHVIGLVKKPNQFKIPEAQELRLLDALSLAGGRTLQIADNVKVIRMRPGGQPAVIKASVKEAKRNGAANIRLAAGDVVSVEETPLTFTIETLRSFIRFGFSSSIPGL